MHAYEVRKVLEAHSSIRLDNAEEREKLVEALAAQPEPTARELRARVERWVHETFDLVPLSIVELAYRDLEGGHLFEIMEVDHDLIYEAFFQQCGEEGEREAFEDDPEDWCENCERATFDEFRDSYINNSYPLWGFLFQCSNWTVIEACKKHGLTIIPGFDNLDDMVGIAGGGECFYRKHWIPIWLSLPWNDEGRARYAGTEVCDV